MILWELSERLRLREVLTRLYPAEVCGVEHVPATGPVIFVSPHCNPQPHRISF